MIAALFVDSRGPYAGLPDVEVWDEARDARLYAGQWPVVAHPPCERWGNYWFGGPRPNQPRFKMGSDGGCFVTALNSVRRFGGVLEHPAGSRAWPAFGLKKPPLGGGWVLADWHGGWTCRVDQGHYGHRANKPTWLYAVTPALPSLTWGRATGGIQIDRGFRSTEARRKAVRRGPVELLSHRERAATPIAFRDLLLGMARSVRERAA
jgi:hypothetical protein